MLLFWFSGVAAARRHSGVYMIDLADTASDLIASAGHAAIEVDRASHGDIAAILASSRQVALDARQRGIQHHALTGLDLHGFVSLDGAALRGVDDDGLVRLDRDLHFRGFIAHRSHQHAVSL